MGKQQQPRQQQKMDSSATTAPGHGASATPFVVVAGVFTTLGIAAVVALVSLLTWRQVVEIQTVLERENTRVLASLERQNERIAQFEGRFDALAKKVETAASAAAKPARRGPDRNKVHSINTAQAAVKGPSNAPITIAEFSDFQ